MTEPGANIVFATLPNLRDLGGWRTADGHVVRSGCVYRSVELGRIDEADLTGFAGLGIRTVIDLRTAAETDASPDRLPDGVTGVHLDVLADADQSAPAQLAEVLKDPTAAAGLLADGKVEAIFENAYRDIVRLPSALASYRRLYTDIADATQRPLLFHCTTGKDRTGWGTAALLSFLGVPHGDVVEEYLLTNTQLLPALEPLLARFESAGGDRALLLPVLGVSADYLAAAFDEVSTRFGGIQGYFDEGLRLPASVQRALRDALLE